MLSKVILTSLNACIEYIYELSTHSQSHPTIVPIRRISSKTIESEVCHTMNIPLKPFVPVGCEAFIIVPCRTSGGGGDARINIDIEDSSRGSQDESPSRALQFSIHCRGGGVIDWNSGDAAPCKLGFFANDAWRHLTIMREIVAAAVEKRVSWGNTSFAVRWLRREIKFSGGYVSQPQPQSHQQQQQRIDASLNGLTREQRAFVEGSIKTLTTHQNPRVVVVEGPPGSGKTKSVVRVMTRWAQAGKRVLCVTTTNRSAHHLTHTFVTDARFYGVDLLLAADAFQVFAEQNRSRPIHPNIAVRVKSARTLHRSDSGAAILVCTIDLALKFLCGSSNTDVDCRFANRDVIVFEEASQIPLYKGLILMHVRASMCQQQQQQQQQDQQQIVQVLISGDRMQLPPHDELRHRTKSKAGVESLLDMALDWPDIRSFSLTHQFRMAEQISDFISRLFYNDRICYVPNAELEEVPASLRGTARTRVRLIGIESEAQIVDTSYESDEERGRILAVLREFKSRTKDRSWTFGVLTFYAQQKLLLLEQLSTAVGTDAVDMTNVSVLNVDECQGQEFDCVILATTTHVATDFMTLVNRVNVSCSRAKRFLIMFANVRVLNDADTIWHKMDDYLQRAKKPPQKFHVKSKNQVHEHDDDESQGSFKRVKH